MSTIEPFENDETRDLARAFGYAESGAGAPRWVRHLDALKTREKDERTKVTVHSASVAERGYRFARHLGMPERDAEQFRVALIWHDVGKLVVPTEVLEKPGGFEPEERKQIEMHAANGEMLMNQCEGTPAIFSEVARYHHEKYRGGGYDGLSHEEIPIMGRLAQIVDVYDALRDDTRPYKPGFTPIESMDRMLSETDERTNRRDFDPYFMRQFVQLLLETELVDVPEADLEPIRKYARSGPMEDLGPDALKARVMIQMTGERTLLGLDAEGKTTVVERRGRFGEVLDGPTLDTRFRPD